jgi:hypothetical protein
MQREKKIDFFMSHSWSDTDGHAKYCALEAVATAFRRDTGRWPTFWLDCVCFDQADLSNSLRVLPVNIQACDRVLVLCGETYCTRLWCVWELYIVFAFAPKDQAAARVLLQELHPAPSQGDGRLHGVGSDRERERQNERESERQNERESETETAHENENPLVVDIPTLLSEFDLSTACCYDPNEELKIRRVIADCGEADFESHINELGRALLLSVAAAKAAASLASVSVAQSRRLSTSMGPFSRRSTGATTSSSHSHARAGLG